VTAAFNEETNLTTVVPEWVKALESHEKLGPLGFEIVLVDDGSTDGTWKVMESLSEQFPGVVLAVRLENNKGAGFAFGTGLFRATGLHLAIYDADGQYSIEELLKAHDKLTGSVALCGYRKRREAPFLQALGSLATNSLFKILFGRGISDPNCAWKVFPRSMLDSAPVPIGRTMVYSGEHSYMIHRSRIEILNVPVVQAGRTSGKSGTRVFQDGVTRVFFFFYLWIGEVLVNKGLIRERTGGF
jgi:glycosyltransferase involved in cell wall biosynthesis